MRVQRSFLNRSLFVLGVVLTSLNSAIWSSDGTAQTDQSTTARAVLGSEIARVWCTQCHAIGANVSGTLQSDVPTFYQIANRSGQSAERITGFLIDPHPPMPNLHLSGQQMSDLATYIMSLKQSDGS